MPGKATIKDVAERAGCGISTVSRVLNGSGATSAETRARVLAAADALSFSFSETGRSLRRQSSRTLGCLVPSLVNPVFADAVQALQAEALASGYHLLLMCSNYDAALELDAMRMLIAKDVDAVALTVWDAGRSEALALARRRGVKHCLMFNAPARNEAAFYVENARAAAEVARAFAAAGHRRVGFLALRFQSSDRSRERFEGFRDGCRAMGLAEPVLLETEEDPGALPARLRALLGAQGDLTGLFASNDFLAIAALRSARDLGRRVPQDLSIVGFDGIAMGDMLDPALATIVTDPRAMGHGAARALIDAIAAGGDPEGPGIGLPYEFRRGGSLSQPLPEKTDAGDAATSPASHHHPKRDNPAHQERRS